MHRQCIGNIPAQYLFKMKTVIYHYQHIVVHAVYQYVNSFGEIFFFNVVKKS